MNAWCRMAITALRTTRDEPAATRIPSVAATEPSFDPEKGLQESKDACAVVPDHYHETNAASSKLAPAWACTAIELLGGKTAEFPACARQETQTRH